MKYQLENLNAYRIYEKRDGPLAILTGTSVEEVIRAGYVDYDADLIKKLYSYRKMFEKLMYQLFKQNGGHPTVEHPYYFVVFDELPYLPDIYQKYKVAVCLKVPMSMFPKDLVSFTYGYSYNALVRKDGHPAQRKLLGWEDAEKVINEFPYDKNEHIWLEMHVWDDAIMRELYNNGDSEYILHKVY